MSYFNHFELKPINYSKEEFELVIFLDDFTTEFGNEFLVKSDSNDSLLDSAKKLILNHYPGIKVTMVRVMVSGIIFASFPISSIVAFAETSKVKKNTVESNGDSSNLYIVQSGDTLWKLSQRFQTTVDHIKKANNLESDTLHLNQQLIMPSSNISTLPPSNPNTHTVNEGDTLSGIAKQYNVPVNQIIILNQLADERIQPGQVLHLKNEFIKGNKNQIGTVNLFKPTGVFIKNKNGTLQKIKSLPPGGSYKVYSIDYEHKLYNVGGNNWIKVSSNTHFTRVGELVKLSNKITYRTHTVVSGDTIWDLSVKYGIPQSELLSVNRLKLDSPLTIGQQIKVPQHHIPIKPAVNSRYGEHLDWWTEAQYVVPIGKTFKVTDFATGKSFMVKRTIGANHADCETVTTKDSNIAKGIWNGYSWKERAVIIEVDGRKIAASMSFMPHEMDYIKNNGINGHFDIHFKNSTRHKDSKIDNDHQRQINIAAGVKTL